MRTLRSFSEATSFLNQTVGCVPRTTFSRYFVFTRLIRKDHKIFS